MPRNRSRLPTVLERNQSAIINTINGVGVAPPASQGAPQGAPLINTCTGPKTKPNGQVDTVFSCRLVNGDNEYAVIQVFANY